MKKVHLFFPENDLALARDLANYTPPPAATKLRRAGEALPLWYAEPDDSFIATGINAQWIRSMRDTFGITVDLYDYNSADCIAAPWGWSKASRKMFAARGFKPAQLPSDTALVRIRELSHRRTAALIAQQLQSAPALAPFTMAPPAAECTTFAQVLDFADSCGKSVIKLPWSSSGRGLVLIDPATAAAQAPMIEGMIRRQGSVMAEPFMAKLRDFAMLFTIADGRCAYNGLSLFTTDRLGAYTGNRLAPQDQLAGIIAHPALRPLAETLPGIIEKIIDTDYNGPLGVDMMTLADGTIAPAVELNLRNTMGHLALRLYERHISNSRTADFTILPGPTAPDAPIVRDGRLASGTLNLTPPSPDFTFRITVNN